MSRDPTNTKAELLQAVRQELRAFTTEIDGLDSRAAERFGLNRSDLRCLDVLSQSGSISPTALAKAVGMSTGGLSISLGRLERAGYVIRTMDPDDRRRVSVVKTPKARALEDEVFGPLSAHVGQLLGRYSKDELAVIHHFLRSVRGAVESAGLTTSEAP
jgi:DNA-binding MarR family transcriptional regulator